MPIVGSRTQVLVDGTPVKMALGPTRVGQEWLVPAGPLAKALGAELEMGARRDYFVVRRAGDRVFYSPGCPEVLVNGQMIKLEAAPQVAAGYPLIPLRSTVTLLGGSVGWDEKRSRVLVWDGRGLAVPSVAGLPGALGRPNSEQPSRGNAAGAPSRSPLR